MEDQSSIEHGSDRSSSQPEATATAPPQPMRINDSEADSGYANFCRISGTPEELLIDFGLNPQPLGNSQQPIVVSQRIVTNWYTAKRLLKVLQMTVARHEAAFGVLETDVQRRVARPRS